jgi:RimJ/RimL family protein N-acetyltransferase
LNLGRVPLVGNFVRLEPYEDAIKEELRQALDCDAEAWNVFASSGQGQHFEAWWANSEREMRAGRWLSYAIRDLGAGNVVGTSSFLNIRPERQSVEIGATFLHPSARARHANPESKLLMLRFAFENGARRVELVTDLRNVRSQAAIAKLGAVREGVMRRDRITWTGHVRDSVLYSITDLDWPAVKLSLESRLATHVRQARSVTNSRHRT